MARAMIVVFGASTDIGRRLIERLHSAGLEYRGVSRTAEGAIRADLQTGANVSEVVLGAKIIVSCAHARYTEAILAAAPLGAQLILIGSAWRYSRVPNARADQVRKAEALFLASEHSGIMLHPTMIYGGNQENNIRRLLRVIRRLPVIPAPGGGRQIVCPIYIDDLADCLFSAVTRKWKGQHVLAVSGPPLTWRRMVEITAQASGSYRPVVYLPTRPVIAALDALRALGFSLDPDVIRRFSEDVDISTDKMRDVLAVTPRHFESGIVSAIKGWALPAIAVTGFRKS